MAYQKLNLLLLTGGSSWGCSKRKFGSQYTAVTGMSGDCHLWVETDAVSETCFEY